MKIKIPKKAIRIIKNNSGTSFDPNLVDIFMEHEKDFYSLGGAGV